MQPEQESYFRNVLHLSDEIQLAGVEFQLSEKINRREKETAGYPLTGFLADTGGALGLFLGLSLLQIFSWCGNIWKILTRWVALVQIYTSKFQKVCLKFFIKITISENCFSFQRTPVQKEKSSQDLALQEHLAMDVQFLQSLILITHLIS